MWLKNEFLLVILMGFTIVSAYAKDSEISNKSGKYQIFLMIFFLIGYSNKLKYYCFQSKNLSLKSNLKIGEMTDL